MDLDIMPLVIALNRISGLETLSSCAGHGSILFIIFTATKPSLKKLLGLLKIFNNYNDSFMKIVEAVGRHGSFKSTEARPVYYLFPFEYSDQLYFLRCLHKFIFEKVGEKNGKNIR